MNALTDVWGEAALKQPGGPSYEFFENLLPPLRYVDTRFRNYPIVLSAPGGLVKARLVSDGSQINALARQPNWTNEVGIPLHVRVGPTLEVFGQDLHRLDGPKLEKAYLPIVHLRYRQGENVYEQEVFTTCDPSLEKSAVVFARFSLPEGKQGKFELQLEIPHLMNHKDGVVRDRPPAWMATSQPDPEAILNNRIDEGPAATQPVTHGVVACFDKDKWVFNVAHNTMSVILKQGESATVALYTLEARDPLPQPMSQAVYDQQRQMCIDAWEKVLARGMQVDVPEQRVNDTYRGETIGNFSLLTGDQIRYSAGNQYAKLYIGEGGDATRTFMLTGYTADARQMMPPLFHYTRKNLEFHQAGFKLQMLAHYYWLTRDKDTLRDLRPQWEKELNVIRNGREKTSGMLPREKYCGDIDTMVYSLNSNSNCWRALRDMSCVLADYGETELAEQLKAEAADYRKRIFDALEKSIHREVNPPFVPIALSGEEDVHSPIWGSVMGSYWNLMIEYVLGSGVFPYNSQTTTDILHYLQQNGGLCMGMLRARAVERVDSFWMPGGRINDLYGTRYPLTLLERDEPDRALISFYGKMAQGMTRDTYEGCEGSGITPLNEFGRQMYLPPNSAANSNFLQQLRFLLVQDWDLDDDGRPDTLRLLFATPRKWLVDGKTIRVEHAPTAFGEVSARLESHVNQGQVRADVSLPQREQPAKTLLRFRLPEGYRLVEARAENRALPLADRETADLTGLRGQVQITAKVEPAK